MVCAHGNGYSQTMYKWSVRTVTENNRDKETIGLSRECCGSLHFSLLSARHVVRAALAAFPRPLMRSPAFPALCDALHFLFRLNAALGHSLGLGITPQWVTIKPHPVL